MISTLEYAKLSQVAYQGDNSTLDSTGLRDKGWASTGLARSNPDSGFQAEAFRKGDQVVIAYRGTEPSTPTDLTTDGQIALGWEDQQFKDTLEFARRINNEYADDPDIQISATGHSLGGGEAQLAADVFGWGGETFDPPGMADYRESPNGEIADFLQETGRNMGHVGDLTNYTVYGSAISSLPGPHIGRERQFRTDAGNNPLLAAVIENDAVSLSDVAQSIPYDNVSGLIRDQLARHSLDDNIIPHFESQADDSAASKPQLPDMVKHAFDIFSRFPQHSDPFTLDLDGDGLETVGADSAGAVQFDVNADGVKTTTGWVAPDDGFLALDRNGNDTIDDGRELFGDATPVGDDGNVAADGFDAVAAQDTNGDGQVDADDANWDELRVWQDTNRDGVSQKSELHTLSELGIQSINTQRSEHLERLANGNILADLGTYTRSDGATGTTGTTDRLADLDLDQDTFHSDFSDAIPLTDEAEALPKMGGSGQVRDLREAASLDTAAGRQLADVLGRYAAAGTRAEQQGLLDSPRVIVAA